MSPAKAISRRTKVATLVPSAIASCVATSTILATSGASALPPKTTPLPDSRAIPTKSIEIQATVTSAGQVAPAIPARAVDAAVSGVSTSGIPAVALSAYQRAAQIINAADPTCNMPWELIGAIGRVESDNGQFGGNHLTASGEAVPGIYGPVLDGKGGVGLVRDTDGGVLDHNTTYDRAVGPMQFLPSTWAIVGVDATGSGTRDPQNIYDAALATAVYLCSGHSNMGNPADVRASVFRYNHSDAYVNLVVRIMQAYETGNFSSIPAGSYGAAAEASGVLPKSRSVRAVAKTSARASTAHPAGSPTAASTPSGTPKPSPTRAPNVVQGLLNSLTGHRSPTPAPSSSPMSSSQAAAYCTNRLVGVADLLGVLHAECRSKLTGMTPAQATADWSAHATNIGAWLGQ